MRLLRGSPALRWIIACAAVLLAVKAMFLVMTPLRVLVMSPWLLDDSFIVARVARNIALGYGFSFDGTHPTTGVSMLWTSLTSLHHVLLPKEIAVKAALLLSTLIGSLCTIAASILALHVTGSRLAAWLMLLLTSLSPVAFFNAMNGMETALFSLFVILALGGASGALTFGRTPLARGIWLGLLCGLALLTRADAIFLVAAVILVRGWEWVRAAGVHGSRTARRDALQEALGLLDAVAVCFGILLLWQLMQSGSPFPANQVGRRAIALQQHSIEGAIPLLTYAKIVAWNMFETEMLWTLSLGSSLLALFALLAGFLDGKLRPLATVTTLYILLFCAALVLYQWYFPDFHGLRYFNGATHVLLIFTASLLARLLPDLPRAPLLALFCAAFLILTWYRFTDYARSFPSFRDMTILGQRKPEAQRRFWGMIDGIREILPAEAVIAARDHGRLAFFTDRSVQDLAGIIDPVILSHRAEGTVGTYLRNRGVTHALLPDAREGATTIYQAVHESLPLEILPDLPPQEITGYRLYRVLPDGTSR